MKLLSRIVAGIVTAATLTLQTLGTPSFSIETYQNGIEPGSGPNSGGQSAIFKIVKTGTETSGSVSVRFAMSGFYGGSSTVATFGTDYTLGGAGTTWDSQGIGSLSFNLANSYMYVYAAPNWDLDCELTESVTFTLQAGAGYGLTGSTSATATIADTPVRGHYIFPGGLISGNGLENGNSVYRIILKRSCANAIDSGDYPASYYLSGTAAQGLDYYVTGSTTILNQTMTTAIDIHFIDDQIQEGTEYIYVSYGPNQPTLFAIAIGDDESCEPAPPSVTGKYGDHQVKLAWNAVPNAQSYKVKRATYTGGAFSSYQDLATVTTTSYDDNSAINDTTYSYIVTTIGGTCGTARESAPSTAIEKTPKETVVSFAAVPGILVEGGSLVKIRATLSRPLEVDLQIYITWMWDQTTATWNSDWQQSGNMIVPGDSTFTDLTITPIEDSLHESPETIVYRLDGGYYHLDPNLASHTVTLTLYDNDPGEPPILNGAAGNSQVLLTWPDHPGALSYKLVRTQGGSSVTLLNNAPPSTTSFIDETVVNGSAYSYVLYATTAGGTTQSPPVTATPQNTLGGSGYFSGNDFYITVAGAMLNKPCAIEASDDMVNWTYLTQNLSLTTYDGWGTAIGYFTDSAMITKPVRYYRFRSGSPIDGATAVTSPSILAFQHITLPASNGSGSGGWGMVGIQLQHSTMALSSYFNGWLPLGLKAFHWNETSQAYDTAFVYGNSGWTQNGTSANLSLALGDALFMQNQMYQTLTLTVIGYTSYSGGSVTSLPSRTSMHSSASPQAGSLPSLGLVGQDGMTVYTWDKSTQNYKTYSYDSLFGGWSPSLPVVQSGEGFQISSPAASQWTQQVLDDTISVYSPVAGIGRVKVTGPWYQTEQIQASSDLINWSNAQTVNSGPRSGEGSITSDFSTMTARFYRVNGSGRRSTRAAGFYKVWVPPQSGGSYGWVMAANQLNSAPVGTAAANTLQSVLPSVTAGLNASKWNETTHAWDVYNNPSGSQWQKGGVNANPSFAPGETMFFQNPTVSGFYLNFFGEVPEGTLTLNIPAGQTYRASILPQQVDVGQSTTFPAINGMTVQLYNSSTQAYQSYSFDDIDWAWMPSAPVLKLGEGFAVTAGSALTWTRIFAPW